MVSQESIWCSGCFRSFLSFALGTAGLKVLLLVLAGYTLSLTERAVLLLLPTMCLNSLGMKVLFVSMPGFYGFIHSLRNYYQMNWKASLIVIIIIIF